MSGDTEAFRAIVEHGHSVDGDGEERKAESRRLIYIYRYRVGLFTNLVPFLDSLLCTL